MWPTHELKPLLVSVKETRRLTNLGNTTIWALIKDGRIKTKKIGRRTMVIYASIEELAKADDEDAE